MNRVLSKPPRDSSWVDYHKKMEKRYRYFVTSDLIDPFYTNENIETIKSGLKGHYIDVFVCGWEKDTWDSRPYRYVFSKDGSTCEFFARPDTLQGYLKYNRPAGIKKNGEWKELYYLDYTREYRSSFFWTKEGYCSVIHNGSIFFRESSGVWREWKGDRSFELEKPPLDDLITQARRINARKWRGFYQTIIEFLINEGMNETQII